MRSQKSLTLAVALVAGITVAALPDDADAAPPTHCTPFYLAGSGLVCHHPEGIYEMFDSEGRSQGFTHGPDPPQPPPDGVCIMSTGGVGYCPSVPARPPERIPYCVDGTSSDFYTAVIYARSFDDVYEAGHQLDFYLDYAGTGGVRQEVPGVHDFSYSDDDIRSFVHQMNWVVYDAGMRNDIQSDMKVVCSQGAVKVHRVVLWQPVGLVDFQSLTQELAGLGFNQPNGKYLIYYDHAQPDCGCAGQGGRMPDDRLVVGNMNNGQVPQYAVAWDAPGWFVLLHEWGHTMGAVQDSAPHSTLGGHCWDKLDVMCYADNGLYGVNYTRAPRTCPGMEWDCGEDDYFSTAPAAGSYLTGHWNIGDPMDRFVALGASNMQDLACAAEGAFVGVPLACTFVGGNPGAGTVTYRVDWGDGTAPTVVTATAGSQASATHSYGAAAVGVRRIHVTAQDATAPNPSGGMPWEVTVTDPAGAANACVAGTDDCPVDVELWG